MLEEVGGGGQSQMKVPTVAKVMANAALLEQMLISGSTAMIFLTLDTIAQQWC